MQVLMIKQLAQQVADSMDQCLLCSAFTDKSSQGAYQ